MTRNERNKRTGLLSPTSVIGNPGQFPSEGDICELPIAHTHTEAGGWPHRTVKNNLSGALSAPTPDPHIFQSLLNTQTSMTMERGCNT